MSRTPWTKQPSSFPSDRIRPHPPPQSSPKGKGKSAASEPPKSKAVRQLEALKKAVSASYNSSRGDPKGGCFCQAREHSLSTYSALCKNCGLVLCEINLPQYVCPHCSSELLTPPQRDALVARLEAQIADTLTKEALQRERAAEEARRAVGQFPTLSGRAGSGVPPAAAPQTRTVMSLNSKTKKVTVSSFTTTPVSSRPASRAESVEEEPIRVPKPPAEVPHCAGAKIDPKRPWRDLSGRSALYIAGPNLDGDGDGEKTTQRRRNRGKKKAQDSRSDGGGGDGASGSGSTSAPTIVG